MRIMICTCIGHTGYAQTLEEKDGAGTVNKTFTLGHDVLAQMAAG